MEVLCGVQLMEIVKDANRDYLRQYLEYLATHAVPPAPLASRNTPPHVAELCFDLTYRLAHQYKDVFKEAGTQARTDYVMREDDTLGLFFYGSLVTCVSHMTESSAELYKQQTGKQRDTFLESNGHLFVRSKDTPLVLPADVSAALAASVDEWRRLAESGGSASGPPTMLTKIFETYPLNPLGGRMGYYRTCVALLVGLITIGYWSFSRWDVSVYRDPQSTADTGHLGQRAHKRSGRKLR